MKTIPHAIVNFLERQSFVIVSTLDAAGSIHCAAKGIIAIEEKGIVHLIDVYRARTFENLSRSKTISLTAIDEHAFKGYTLKGSARIVAMNTTTSALARAWESRLVKRISHRVIRNVQAGSRGRVHPEAQLPLPEYLIQVVVRTIVDLAPVFSVK